VLLHDRAIGRHDREDRLASPVWRWAQQRRCDGAGFERAPDDLRLRRRGHDFPVGQIAGIDAADLRVRSAGERQTVRVEDRGRTNASIAKRRIGRPDPAESVVVG
jgi:hypothetical protein